MSRPTSQNSPEIIKARGKRLCHLREILGLSKTDFEKLHNIKASRLSKIENGKNNLTLSLARTLVLIANEYGICCTIPWLLEGEGDCPIEYIKDSVNINVESQIQAISLDIKNFLTSYQNLKPEVFHVSDESMLPLYKPGDYVGGIPIKLERIRDFFDYPFIVEIEDGRKVLRRLTKDKYGFILYGINFSHKGSPYVILHPKIMKASPVFWHRVSLTPWVV